MYNKLFSHLVDLNKTSHFIEASAIVSTDGLVMASTLPHNMDADNVGAMSAAMLSVGNRGSNEFVGGALEQMLIKGTRGYILMTLISKELILTVMAKPTVKLDQLFIEIKQSAEKIIAIN